jgi:hypothetical protein
METSLPAKETLSPSVNPSRSDWAVPLVSKRSTA